MSKRCKLQNEYCQQYGNYKGNGKYSDKYVSWLENEVLALRQMLVSGELAVDKCECIRFTGGDKWYPNGCKIHPNG